jgi:hypothetical protein
MKPLEKYPGSQAEWLYQCLKCKETYRRELANIVKSKGCGNCAEGTAAKRERAARAKNAEQYMLDKRAKPLEPYPGNNAHFWRCQCLVCFTEIPVTFAYAKSLDRKLLCAPCNFELTGKGAQGFCDGAPGVLYLLNGIRPSENDGTMTSYFKIGITNRGQSAAKRFRKHRQNGWRVIDQRDFELGRNARKVETRVKERLDELNIPRGAALFREKFDGYTETWLGSDLSAYTLADLLNVLAIDITSETKDSEGRRVSGEAVGRNFR